MKRTCFIILMLASLCLGIATMAQIPNTAPPLALVGQNCGPVPENCAVPNIVMPSPLYLCPGTVYTFSPTINLPPDEGGWYGYTLENYNWQPASGIYPSSSATPMFPYTPLVTSVLVPDAGQPCVTHTLYITAVDSFHNLIQKPYPSGDGNFSLWINGDCNYLGCMESTYDTHGSCIGGTDPNTVGIGRTDQMEGSTCLPVENGHTPDTGSWTWCLNVHSTTWVQDGIHYFWGEQVELCPGADYVFTYWVRPYAAYPIADTPVIQMLIGNAGPGETLEQGYPFIGSPTNSNIYFASPPTTVHQDYANGCRADSLWQEVTFTFNADTNSGTKFICMYNTAIVHTASEFSIDDISLYRITHASQSITICPIQIPTLTVTASAANACVGAPFSFTIHGNAGSDGDVVSYYIMMPDSTIIPGVGTITGGVITVPVGGSSITGAVCLNVDSVVGVPSSEGMCREIVPLMDTCIQVYQPPLKGMIKAPKSLCANNPNFVAVAEAGGVTGPLSYEWTCTGSGVIVGPASLATATIMITGPGTIYYTCIISNSCGSYTATAVTIISPSPVISMLTTPPGTGANPVRVVLCDGLEAVNIYADVTAGGPVTNYEWTATGPFFPDTGAIITATPMVPIDTYAVLVTNTYSCSATASVDVYLAQQPCICTYEENGSAPFNTMAPGAMTAPPAAGNWSLTSSLTITGSMTWDNVVLTIGPGVLIIIKPGATLTLKHCHLFSCPGNMWEGIGYSSTARLVVEDNTLIEDATVAVNIQNPYDSDYVAGNNPLAPFVLSTGPALAYDPTAGAIFNKNGTGILVSASYNLYVIPTDMATDLNPGYPYVIQNTVFTGRDFSHYHTGFVATTTTSWPFVWPGTEELKQVTGWPGLTAYEPPYRIDAPNAYGPGEGYPMTACNNGQKPFKGIDLESIDGDGGYEPIDFYSYVVVGTIPTAGNHQLNLFDNLGYGIYAYGSNLAVRNSAFIHVWSQEGPGGTAIATNNVEGIYSGPTCDFWAYGSPTVPNLFYDCPQGIYSNGMWAAEAEYTKMYSARTSIPWEPVADETGYSGIEVLAGGFGYDIEINHNSLYNIMNPISVGSGGLLTEQVTIENNTIRATTSGTATTQSVMLGIYLDNEGTSQYDGEGNQENINNNTLDQVYNGIWLNGSLSNYVVETIDGNTVNMSRDVVSTTYNTVPQMGIEATNSQTLYVDNNTITGAGYNVPLPPSYLSPAQNYLPPIMEGIHIAAVINGGVQCNTMQDINTATYFGGTNVISCWGQNHLQNNAYGFILDGYIGPQQIDSTAPATYTTGNEWLATALGFSWTGTNYQTYTMNNSVPDFPTGSPLSIATGSPQNDPTNNFTDEPVIPSNVYGGVPGIGTGSGNGLYVSATAPAYPCEIPPPSGIPPSPMALPVKNGYVQAAQAALPYVSSTAQKNWIGQMATWNVAPVDSTMDTAAVLTTFHSMANTHSRYKYLAGIEKDIALGSYATAETKLAYPIDTMMNNDRDMVTGAKMADDTAADEIVHHYKRYYHLQIRYKQHSLTAADSAEVATLANMCPFTDGSVVYKARGLYNRIYPLRTFSDIGCGESNPKMPDSRKSNTVNSDAINGQSYILYPNPSDGNIMLQQKVPDNNPVSAEVINATGMSVYKGIFHFVGGTTSFTMHDKVPGLYVLHLTDSKGNEFILKFTIE